MRAISVRDRRGFRVEMLFLNKSLEEEVKLSDDIKKWLPGVHSKLGVVF